MSSAISADCEGLDVREEWHLGRGRPVGDTRGGDGGNMRLNRHLLLCLAAAAPARARALAGHDHDHPVCDEEYRSTVCPAACDADTLRDKCCIHEGEVATLLTVAMEAQSRAIAPRVERFEECTGGHVELVPFVGACTGLSCGGFSDLFEIPERKAMVWDLLVYANVNALEVVSGKLGPTYLDPFRRSHLDATARDTWIPPYDAAAK